LGNRTQLELILQFLLKVLREFKVLKEIKEIKVLRELKVFKV
jgi:hypothetical protein